MELYRIKKVKAQISSNYENQYMHILTFAEEERLCRSLLCLQLCRKTGNRFLMTITRTQQNNLFKSNPPHISEFIYLLPKAVLDTELQLCITDGGLKYGQSKRNCKMSLIQPFGHHRNAYEMALPHTYEISKLCHRKLICRESIEIEISDGVKIALNKPRYSM